MITWIFEYLKEISIFAVAAIVITAVAKGFFGKVGEALYRRTLKRFEQPSDIEVDVHFEAHDSKTVPYAWVPEYKKKDKASEGFTFYIDSNQQARCFRVAIVHGSVTRKEYLMIRP